MENQTTIHLTIASIEKYQVKVDSYLKIYIFCCSWGEIGLHFEKGIILGVPSNYGNRIMAKGYATSRNRKVFGINDWGKFDAV